MTLLALSPVNEDALIDSTGEPDTQTYPASQGYSANQKFSGLVDRESYYLPDPTVGSKGGAGSINGANRGVPSWSQSHRPLDGRIGWFPQIQQNAGQGNVGQSNLATRQYLGTLDQISNYGSTPQYVASANLIGMELQGFNYE